jgi:hypothetical protein
MKPKPRRNKKYIPRNPLARPMQIFELYNVLQPLEELKQSLIRGYLSVEYKIDRANDGRWYNDWTQLIYAHEHTFTIQNILKDLMPDKAKEVCKYSNTIRKVIERYFDKVFGLARGDMIPNIMPISKLSANTLIKYIDNTNLVYKNLSVERYVRGLAYVKSLHLTYCFVHNLVMLELMDVEEELAKLRGGGGIDNDVRVLADKLRIEL